MAGGGTVTEYEEQMRIQRENLVALARLRRELAAADNQWRELVAAFEKANEGLRERRDALRQAVTKLEEEVKDGAVVLFKATGDRDVLPGAKFRMTKVVRYDPDKALEWAVKSAEVSVLKLNGRAFEKSVKDANPSLLKASGLDFVEVDVEPKAVLASNLEAELAKAGVAADE